MMRVIVLGLARIALRRPWRTVGATLILSVLPMISWLASGLAAAALMQHGLASSWVQMSLLLGSMLHYWVWGDGMLLFMLPGIWLGAMAIRQANLSAGMLVLPVFGILLYAYLDSQAGSIIIDNLVQDFQVLHQRLEQMQFNLAALGDPQTLRLALLSAIASGTCLLAVLCLLIGRYLQLDREQPGAYSEEWRAMRLPLSALLLLPLFGVGSILLGYDQLAVLQLVSLPLMLAGLALVHWMGNRLQWGKLVFLAYPLMLFLPLVYLLIAGLGLTDIWFNWRARWAPPTQEDSQPRDGEDREDEE